MEDTRQQAFRKLRAPCVELSAVGLKFKAQLANNDELLHALSTAHRTLDEVSKNEGLDAKLAEYAFFPLTHIFNETKRASSRCLETALRCLEILIHKGWGQDLQPALATQLLILLTMMAGGIPGQSDSQSFRSEELIIAAFDCIRSIFRDMSEQAASTVLSGSTTSPIIDQTVYILLEQLMDSDSKHVQAAAVIALFSLNKRITDRVLLASLLPRTVSSLTRVLTPTTSKRRAYQVLGDCLKMLQYLLARLLDNSFFDFQGRAEESRISKVVLDENWLKTTASQIKLALTNIIRLRTHDRWDVRERLASLCHTVCLECSRTLSDSVPMMIETLVVIASYEPSEPVSKSCRILKKLLSSSQEIADILQSTLRTWTSALPRVVHGQDEFAKKQAIRRVSFAFRLLSSLNMLPEILSTDLASSLCDSATALLRSPIYRPPLIHSNLHFSLDDLTGKSVSKAFPSLVLEVGSESTHLSELELLIREACGKDESMLLPRSVLEKTLTASKESVLEPFWVLVTMLTSNVPEGKIGGTALYLCDGTHEEIFGSVVDELYSFSLPYLTEYTPTIDTDWRLTALALQVAALQASNIRHEFEPELIEVLYPILLIMTSHNQSLKKHALRTLNVIVGALGYPNARCLLIRNVDYLINAVSLRLNAFDISPQGPQVLLLMINLCGAQLIPLLDDLVVSMFSILDAYHGYPKLAETIFAVLGAIVNFGSKGSDTRAITASDGGFEPPKYRPVRNVLEFKDLLKQTKERRTRHDRLVELEKQPLPFEEGEDIPRRPLGPLSSDMLNSPDEDTKEQGKIEELEDEGGDETLPAPEEEKKELSKNHQLLLNIVKTIPSHMSTPSPLLRKNLLEILNNSFTILSTHEDTFLPLINEIWPTVSARMALPSTMSTSPSPMEISTEQVERPPVIDEEGIKEQAYVFVAACDAIDRMVKAAGNFMVTRLEKEFPRWKSMYFQAWKEVKADAERMYQQQAYRRGSLTLLEVPVPHNEGFTLNEDREKDKKRKRKCSRRRRRREQSQSPGFAFRPFTPHHTIWKCLNELFTTMLLHLVLPDDMSMAISNMLGESIVYLAPDRYFLGKWKKAEDDIDRAITAMHRYNRHLTWYIFDKDKRKSGDEEYLAMAADCKRRVDRRMDALRERMGGDKEVDLSKWTFAEYG